MVAGVPPDATNGFFRGHLVCSDSIRPEHFTAEELEFHAMPLPADSPATITKNKLWMLGSNGINGEEKGITAVAAVLQQLLGPLTADSSRIGRLQNQSLGRVTQPQSTRAFHLSPFAAGLRHPALLGPINGGQRGGPDALENALQARQRVVRAILEAQAGGLMIDPLGRIRGDFTTFSVPGSNLEGCNR